MDTEEKSNLLTFQVEALLNEVTVGTAATAKRKKDAALYTGLTKVENLVRNLKEALDEFPSTQVKATKGSVVAGVALHHDYDQLTISPPESVDMMGSYMLGAVTRPYLNVDLAVQMPSDMFVADKDFQNFQYFDKRAVYLAQLAAYLRTKEPFTFSDLSVTFFRGEPLKPILVLYATLPVETTTEAHLTRPTGMLSRFTIRIFPCIARDLFPTRKLAPQRNNTKHYIDTTIPTPYYNQLILEDSLFVTHFEALAEVSAQLPTFAEALSLLKVWATHRGFTAQGVGSTFSASDSPRKISTTANPESKSEPTSSASTSKTLRPPSSFPLAASGKTADKAKAKNKSQTQSNVRVMYEETPFEDSFNGFLLSMVALYLFRQGKILANMPPYKIFHLVLAFLAATDMTSAPISIADAAKNSIRSRKLTQLEDDEDDGDHEESSLTHKVADAPDPALFAAAFEVAFIDVTGLLNLAARVSVSSYRLLRHEALLALVHIEGAKTLDSLVAVKTLTSDDMASILGAGALHTVDTTVFNTLFMTSLQPTNRFDLSCTVTVQLDQIERVRPTESLIKWGQELPLIQSPSPASIAASSASEAGPTPMVSLLFPRNPNLSLRTAIARRAYPLIVRALGSRAYLVNVVPTVYTDTTVTLRVALLLRAEESGRLLDKGPIADHVTEVNEWREFWGSKSELRRFHDGTIHECVAWEAPSDQEQLVSATIMDYILNSNLLKPLLRSRPSERLVHVSCAGTELMAVLKLRQKTDATPQFSELREATESTSQPGRPLAAFSVSALTSEDASTASAKIHSAFLDLSNTLQDMRDLPLGISSVDGIHPALRGTDPFPPLPISLRQFKKGVSGALPPMSTAAANNTIVDIASQGLLFKPLDVVITLNFSPNWPNELLAISRTKTAFLIKIHNLLREEFRIPSTVTAFHIDVFLQGYVFRLHLAQESESKHVRMLFRAEKPLPPLMAASGMSAREHELVHVIRPQHSALVQAISGRFPLYAPIVRLFRRWLAAHFFDSSSISAEVAELLVASVFVFPQPFTVPGSILSGFLRVLTRIATHNWESTPLIVAPFHVFYSADSSSKNFSVTQLDVETDLTRSHIEQIYAKFEQTPQEKRPCIYIATPHDIESRHFTMANVTSSRLDSREDGSVAFWEPNSSDPWNRSRKLGALPGPLETSRLQLLAALTRDQIARLIVQSDQYSKNADNTEAILAWAAIFKAPLEAYDAFILLKPSTLSAHDQRKSLFTFRPKAITSKSQSDEVGSTQGSKKSGYKLPLDLSNAAVEHTGDHEKKVLPEVYAGFEPVELYLKELRCAFGNIANFYYDTFGGRIIAVKLIKEGGSFTTQGCITPRIEGAEVNRAAMFATMSELGNGLVEGIYSDFSALSNAAVY